MPTSSYANYPKLIPPVLEQKCIDIFFVRHLKVCKRNVELSVSMYAAIFGNVSTQKRVLNWLKRF